MYINIDKKEVLRFCKIELLVYIYGLFRSEVGENGVYYFTTESLAEDMEIKNNARNLSYIEVAIYCLEVANAIDENYWCDDDEYTVYKVRYIEKTPYFKLYKHEFDLLTDKSRSLIENAKLLDYFCYILSCLDLRTQKFSISNSFILEGYGSSDKKIKKNNDKLIELGLISVSTERKNGINSTNFYKRLYAEEIVVKEHSYLDEIDEETYIEIKPIYVNVDADAPIENINCYLAKQGNFCLCIDDLDIPYCNDYFDVSTGEYRIGELLLKYREKFNGVTSAKAIKELNKSNVLKED